MTQLGMYWDQQVEWDQPWIYMASLPFSWWEPLTPSFSYQFRSCCLWTENHLIPLQFLERRWSTVPCTCFISYPYAPMCHSGPRLAHEQRWPREKHIARSFSDLAISESGRLNKLKLPVSTRLQQRFGWNFLFLRLADLWSPSGLAPWRHAQLLCGVAKLSRHTSFSDSRKTRFVANPWSLGLGACRFWPNCGVFILYHFFSEGRFPWSCNMKWWFHVPGNSGSPVYRHRYIVSRCK